MESTAEPGCWLGQAVWWRRVWLSASQVQPSWEGLIQEPEREQRATLELLSAPRVLRAQKSRVRPQV